MPQLMIITNSAHVNAEARNGLTTFLQQQQWEIWHWMEDLWLIANAPESLSIGKLRKDIHRILGDNAAFFIVRATSAPITGYVSSDSVAWLTSNWKLLGD